MKTPPVPFLGYRNSIHRWPSARGLSATALTFLALVTYSAAVTPASAEDFAQGANSFSPFHAQSATHVSRSSDQSSVAARASVPAQKPEAIAGSPIIAPTRSSFLASWERSVGATGYRLDVSTGSSFTEYVTGYQNLDVGDTQGRIVFGLKPGTKYYYRVRPYNSNRPGPDSPVASATTAIVPGFVINPTFDASITNNPSSASIQSAINQAIANYQASFSDPVTVSILFRYADTDPSGSPLGSALGENRLVIYTVPWATFINALKTDSTTSNDVTAIASLPASPLSTNILPSSANGRAVGLNTPGAMSSDGSVLEGGSFDGIVTLNSDQTFDFTRPTSPGAFDAITLIQHGIDQILGLGSFLNFGGTNLQPEDLFSWTGALVRSTKKTGTRYFSIDSGRTKIIGFNQDPTGDFGAWLSQLCPQTTPFVQNAFYCPGQFDDVSRCTPEGTALDVIGYNLVFPPGPYNPLADCSVVEWLKADDLSLFYNDGAGVVVWPAAIGNDLVPPFFSP